MRMPYPDFREFGSGTDWGTEIVFSCDSLIIFEMSVGTLEAYLFKYSFKGKCYSCWACDSPKRCFFFQAVFGFILWVLCCIHWLPFHSVKVISAVKEEVLNLPFKEYQYSYKIHSGCFEGEALESLLVLVCSLRQLMQPVLCFSSLSKMKITIYLPHKIVMRIRLDDIAEKNKSIGTWA